MLLPFSFYIRGNTLKKLERNRRFRIPMTMITSMVPETFIFATPAALKKGGCVIPGILEFFAVDKLKTDNSGVFLKTALFYITANHWKELMLNVNYVHTSMSKAQPK